MVAQDGRRPAPICQRVWQVPKTETRSVRPGTRVIKNWAYPLPPHRNGYHWTTTSNTIRKPLYYSYCRPIHQMYRGRSITRSQCPLYSRFPTLRNHLPLQDTKAYHNRPRHRICQWIPRDNVPEIQDPAYQDHCVPPSRKWTDRENQQDPQEHPSKDLRDIWELR